MGGCRHCVKDVALAVFIISIGNNYNMHNQGNYCNLYLV